MSGDTSGIGTPQPAGPPAAAGMFLLPTLWVALIVGLSVYGIARTWPAFHQPGLPQDVVYWIRFEIAVALITILWGIWLFGSAYRRSAGFPRAFTVWQCFRIAALCLSVAFTLVSDSFVPAFSALAVPGAEIAIGIALILFLTRSPRSATVFHADGSARPPAVVVIINAVLGAMFGGVAGTVLGLLAGTWLADVYEVSCFEGACGYFVIAIGLLVMPVGAVAGIVAAIRLTRRRSRRVAA